MNLRTSKIAYVSIVLLFAAFTVNATAQKPTAKTFLDIGIVNSDNAEYSEAIDEFKHAITLKPNYAEAHYHLGNAYFNLHRYEESLVSYKQAVKLKPKYVDAQFSLGILSSMLSNNNDAIKAFKQVIKLQPNNSKAAFSLGNVYYELEKYDEAVEAYKQAVKSSPKYAEARLHLGRAYMQLRNEMLLLAKREYNYLKKVDADLAKDLLKTINNK